MERLAIASGTPFAAEAGAAIAHDGGNAVDAAIAATFVTWVCEPGLTSLGSGGYVCVWAPNEKPLTIDGFVEMPGRSADPRVFGRAHPVTMAYGGTTNTIVGTGSIGTPGSLAAVEEAWRRWGSLPWSELIQPAIHAARRGFPLPAASHAYFKVSGDVIYALTDGARRLHRREDDSPRDLGELVTIPDLAHVLERIARDGAEVFYRGELAEHIGGWIHANDGLLGADDLRAYEIKVRDCLMSSQGKWTLATNPAPAVGGVILTEAVSLMRDRPRTSWTADDVAFFARVLHRVFEHRLPLMDENEQGVIDRAAQLLGPGLIELRQQLLSPSTSHTSAVDANGLGCSITTSTGYGSGIVVPGTGILFNNVLGEMELTPGGLHAASPGECMRSNMAPSVMRATDGSAIAFGAAGADRIVSALSQLWLNIVNLGMSIEEAVQHPRCHVEWCDGEPMLAYEPGVDVRAYPLTTRTFDEPHMYFGGVQAAGRSADGTMSACGDPRRNAGAVVV